MPRGGGVSPIWQISRNHAVEIQPQMDKWTRNTASIAAPEVFLQMMRQS
jgi:hypothetical protein